MRIINELPCYYFTCDTKPLNDFEAYKDLKVKEITIENKTFYFYLHEDVCRGAMKFFDNSDIEYPVTLDWDGYQVISNSYWCLSNEEEHFRQHGFLSYDEMISYIEIGFVEDYLESQFKW